MSTRGIKPGMGRIIIGDTVFEGTITDFTYDPDLLEQYIEDQLKIAMIKATEASLIVGSGNMNMFTMLKIIGLWQWVIDNCPNKRVVHLMQHGSHRTRKKNWHRACSIISRMCTEVKL